jgi:NAD(P)-dependent dehydrogenase (short-subunit alcohol dehydrogenase family)
MTGDFLEKQPGLEEKWSAQNPTGRFGRPDELRGVTLYLASDASTFCTGSESVLFSYSILRANLTLNLASKWTVGSAPGE